MRYTIWILWASGIMLLTGISEAQNEKLSYSSKIEIHVLGEVDTPGVYTVNIGTRLNEAVRMATVGKEINTVFLSRILDKDSVMRHQYNLFEYRRNGDLSQSPFLVNGDVLIVKDYILKENLSYEQCVNLLFQKEKKENKNDIDKKNE